MHIIIICIYIVLSALIPIYTIHTYREVYFNHFSTYAKSPNGYNSELAVGPDEYRNIYGIDITDIKIWEWKLNITRYYFLYFIVLINEICYYWINDLERNDFNDRLHQCYRRI